MNMNTNINNKDACCCSPNWCKIWSSVWSKVFETKILAILAVVSVMISVLVYYFDHRRNSELVRGSFFLSSIDIDAIGRLTLFNKGDKKLVFERVGNHYQLSNFYNYQVEDQKFNDLIYKLVTPTINEKVASGEKYFMANNVSEKDAFIHVLIEDRNGKKMAEYLVGENPQGSGSYLRNFESDQIYMAETQLYLSFSKDSYIDTKFFKIQTKDIKKVNFKSVTGNDFFITKENDKFLIQGATKNQLEQVDENKITNIFQTIEGLSFSDYSPISSTVARDFKTEIRINTIDGVEYLMFLVKDENDSYLKISANIKELPTSVSLNKNASTEELKAVESMLLSRDASIAFNKKHGIWLYKISSETYNKLTAGINGLLKDDKK